MLTVVILTDSYAVLEQFYLMDGSDFHGAEIVDMHGLMSEVKRDLGRK
ncbi:MAG: hypothetical protein ACFC03_02390 [Candidatus Malihini olakiniferum]